MKLGKELSTMNESMVFKHSDGQISFHKHQHPVPMLKSNQVLIKVAAASFNPIDNKIAHGKAPIAAEFNSTGCDVSGDVIAVGDEVRQLQVGDRVIGCAGGVSGYQGTVSRYLVTDADLVVKAPTSISLEDAAALPLAGITAMDMLHRSAPSANDRVMVLGARGAVGQILSQLLQIKHLYPVKQLNLVCGSPEQTATQFIRSYDYQSIVQDPFTVDLVLDTVGGELLELGLSKLVIGGRLTTINARGMYDLTQAHARALTINAVFMLLPRLMNQAELQPIRVQQQEWLQHIVTLVDGGQLQLPKLSYWSVKELDKLHQCFESKELRSKAIIHW